MTKTVISVENLSKSYTLGTIGTGTFSHDLAVWWARVRGKPNPLLRIGETDHGNRVGEEIWALKDVSFQVQQGEVLGVIGRNGAGKSTLLKILSRVTAPTSGEVKVKGRIASLLEVGTGFHPELTGRENIYLNGAILGMTKQEVTRKFDEIVDFSGVEKFIDTPVKRYSSGMYVRLAFAVAAHLESEILLVDEVLAVGDAEFQKKCLGKMGDVAHNEGRTVLFVSHNMGAVQSLCERGLIIQNGYALNCNSITDVVSEYLMAYNALPKLPINERIDRLGIGEVRLEKIIMEGKDGKITNSIVAGSPVKFIFNLNFWTEDINLIFTIYNSQQQRVTTFKSFPSGYDDEELTQDYVIYECNIDSLNLMPGIYYINTAIEVNGALHDHLERAFEFRVLEAIILGRQIQKNPEFIVFFTHIWRTPPPKK